MAVRTPVEDADAPSPLPPGKMTYEEFLDRADEDQWVEWVDGEVVTLSPVSSWHQDLADFLTALVRLFARAGNRGQVRSAPFQMKTGPSLPGREPDLLFIAAEHEDRLKEVYLDGPADLVVEIVSPDSVRRDRVDKFKEYQQGGVREYWVIDPKRKQAEFYFLEDDGRYSPTPIDEDGIFCSRVLDGLWLRVEWLWEEPLPSEFDVFREWKLI